MVKARGSFFSGAGSVAESYNITSVSRTAAGTYTVTIADDFATSDYTVMASAVPSGHLCLCRDKDQQKLTVGSVGHHNNWRCRWWRHDLYRLT